LGQLVGEKCPEFIPRQSVGANDVVDNLRRDRARAFEFGGEGFEQVWHAGNIHRCRAKAKREVDCRSTGREGAVNNLRRNGYPEASTKHVSPVILQKGFDSAGRSVKIPAPWMPTNARYIFI
jgi:hypothetical protein